MQNEARPSAEMMCPPHTKVSSPVIRGPLCILLQRSGSWLGLGSIWGATYEVRLREQENLACSCPLPGPL